jgi:hypothetical protein
MNAKKIKDFLFSTEITNKITTMYKMPDDVKMLVLECTDSVEERNSLLVFMCYHAYMNFVHGIDELEVGMEYVEEFLEAIFKQLLEEDYGVHSTQLPD